MIVLGSLRLDMFSGCGWIMDTRHHCCIDCLMTQAVRRHAGKAVEFSYLPSGHNKTFLLNVLKEVLWDFIPEMLKCAIPDLM